ncbi:MAG TPA: 3-hydroxyacyl-CoA dehydrogenase family protein [Pseudolabrys sp.]
MAVNIQSVGVIGAGQMGNGIAHVCALAGFSVMLNDVSPDRIKASLATINGNMTRQVSKKLITEDNRKAALALIKPAEKYDGLSTCDIVIETATEKEDVKRKIFVSKLGKTIAVSEDFPAFIVNRILLPMINEAIYTLYEGVGNVEAIDTAMRLGAHHPMGPLELADFIGLDTCLSVMQVLHEGLADSKYRPCPLLVKYVEAGWLGRKTQRGFYDYRGEKPVPTR